MVVKKSRKRSVFVIYSYFKYICKVLNKVCERGINCQKKVDERGTKNINGILRGKRLDFGTEPNRIKLLFSASPPVFIAALRTSNLL